MERRTSLRAEARGMRNVWVVEVFGSRGTFAGIRSSLAEARTTARRYAQLLDAPRQVI